MHRCSDYSLQPSKGLFASVVQRPPQKCSTIELDAFEHLVKTGGEVSSVGLHDRIIGAFSLAWLEDADGTLLGVGALKNPNENYRRSIFRKAGSKEEPNKYELELGWIFLKPEVRGQKLSLLLLKELLLIAGDEAIYATTRESNKTMRTILKNFGFVENGKAYPSDEGSYSLVLYCIKI